MERPTGPTLQELQGLGPFRLHIEHDRESPESIEEAPESIGYVSSGPANFSTPADRTGEAITVDRVSTRPVSRILGAGSATHDGAAVVICRCSHARKVIRRLESLQIHTKPYSRIQDGFFISR